MSDSSEVTAPPRARPDPAAPASLGPMVDEVEQSRVYALLAERLFGQEDEAPKVGRFTLLRRVGEGGMSIVYAAYDDQLDRRIAVKILRPGSPTTSARMLLEAQAMGKLSHPNIVPVFEVGAHQDQLFIAMEFVEGQTLRQWQNAEERDWNTIVEKYLQAGRGLAAAHESGVIHRDFKPENAVVGEDGRVRVLDFGLARRGGETDDSAKEVDTDRVRRPSPVSLASPITETGTMMGTPAYMAPEQHRGGKTDERTDQFSFCASLYEALYGERAFQGDSRDQLANSITRGVIPEPPRGTDVPSWVRRAIVKGLATQPKNRWPSMAELLAELDRHPARVRRRIALVVAGILVGAVPFGVMELNERRQTAACESEGERVSGVWNDATKARVRSGLLATDVPYADAAWEGVSRRLEDYAESLGAVGARVCLQAEVQGTWTREQHALAQQCLDERRSALTALLGVLAEADTEIVQQSVGAAADLEPLGPCIDPARLDRQMPLPALPQQHEQVVAARRELWRAKALWLTWKYDDGLGVVENALATAEALDYDPLRAEALVMLGMVQEKRSKFDEAEQALETAYFLATEIGLDAIAGEAARRLVFVVGRRQYRMEEGLRWAKHARTAQLDDLATAQLLRNLGTIHRVRGSYEEAARHYIRGLMMRRKALSRDHPSVASLLDSLANVRRDQAEYGEATRHLIEALNIFRKTLGDDHPNVAVALNNLGNVYLEQGDYSQAIELYERALKIRENAGGPKDLKVSWPLRNLGRVHIELGEHDQARDRLARALAIREAELGPKHANVAFVLETLGELHLALGEYDRAAERLNRAVTILEDVLDRRHPELTKSLSSLGLVHLARGEHELAAAHLTRALEIRERKHGPNHPAVARTLNSLGLVHAAQGAHDEAADFHTRALSIWEASLEADHPHLADALIGLAEARAALGRPNEIRLLERALAIRAQVGNAVKVADARMALARALWTAPERAARDRERARTLAESARTTYAQAEHTGPRVTEVDAWLRTHRSEQ